MILNRPVIVFSQNIGDHLILQDISLYKLDRPEKYLPGEPPSGGPRTYDSAGIVAGTGHFSLDHTDKTYEVMYLGGDANVSPTVQVTKHTDPADSLRWLRHEVERGFRDTDNLESGPDEDSMIREINGNKIFFYGGGIVGYRWLSNNIVVNIQYNNLGGPKPEPLEVVKAYLAKHPSSIVLSDIEFKARAHNETWIKDEMARRLWLCDKWFYQLQLGKAQQREIFEQAVKSMNVFLDYREKYYSVKATNEKNLLATYLNTNNGTGIKAKLKEYKDWWVVNKDKAINL